MAPAHTEAVDKIRTDTTLLLDIKEALAINQTQLAFLVEAQRDAAVSRDRIYAKIGKVDERLEKAERLAEKARDIATRLEPIVDSLNQAHQQSIGGGKAMAIVSKVAWAAVGAIFTAIGWLLNHYGGTPRP